MKNLGSYIASYGFHGFQAIDSNGVIHDPDIESLDCILDDLTDVLPGGILEGCILFQVPNDGYIEIVYAPSSYDKFAVDRSLSWDVLYNPVQGPGVIEPAVKISNQSEYRPQFSNAWAYTLGDKLVGEMQYIGTEPIQEFEVQVTTYDANNHLLEIQDGVSWQEYLLPGDKVIFWSRIEKGNWKISDVEIMVNAMLADEWVEDKLYRDFRIINFKLHPTDSIWYQMVGEIENDGESSVTGVGIDIIAYDKDGNIIGYDQGGAGYNLDNIEPGMTSPIEGQMRIYHPSGLDAVDHFDFLFQSYTFDR